MSALSLIHRYNRLNGNAIGLPKLKEFREAVQRHLDSVGHGPYVPDLKGILARTTALIKQMQAGGFEVVERLQVTPIATDKPEHKPVAKQKPLAKAPQKATVAKREKRKAFKPKARGKKPVKKVEVKPAKKEFKPTPLAAPKVVAKRKKKHVAKKRKKLAPKDLAKPALAKIAKKEKPKPVLSGVGYTYKEVELGPYKEAFHRMFTDTIVQIHGLPGHGKTVWLLKFAQYRAELGDRVLYVAREEYGRSVFDMKLREHNIGHKNLRFRRQLDAEDIQWATVVFLDSVSALKLDHEDVEELAAKYPNRNWILVLQSTKDGDFRGSQEWEHLVDVAGEIHNRRLILRKNRLDPNNSAKAEQLLKESAIKEARKRAEIRNAVKQATGNQQQATALPTAA